MLTIMARLPLHTLPTFRLVAKRQNLRAAADELHLTHSAVSQQIKLLEEQIGFELFDRSGRRIALNPAGAALLPAVEAALTQLDEGLRAATATAAGDAQRVRVTLLPSFGQRWLLPRMGRWRARHPCIALEIEVSQKVIDLQREGFHVALRQGAGPWRGLVCERLIASPRVAVATPEIARRLRGADAAMLADEPLLGDADLWQQWFAQLGHTARVNPVASFNDAGMMLQATEQGLGLALTRELLAADALRDGRLVRLSQQSLQGDGYDTFWFVYPPGLADWPPLKAFHAWLREELAQSAVELTGGVADDLAGAASVSPAAP
ncbi:LysR family transcriptional regulator [Aquincola sp. S2]|uniref:LysR family transcriptional regulator n=1 Tax=Pseudaquabacterium terrae TaxID=2732868 RepID=A0ABX2ENM4_9BURK|nr:LysR substrate-binding domain-containing protein [Aquabacterium terrae]NRF70150.1 LysR family transcriptional regulator [Aquabacterium terrae]